ncbi:MAG: hypothetical protein ACUZ8E_03675, partial [Candidatus Anammoxibacter sp.]
MKNLICYTLIRTYYRKEVMDRKQSPRKILIIDDDDCRKLILHMLASQFQDIEAVEYDPQSQGIPGKNFNWSAFDVLLL